MKEFTCCAKNCNKIGTMTESVTGPTNAEDDYRKWYCRNHYRTLVLNLKPVTEEVKVARPVQVHGPQARTPEEGKQIAREWLEVVKGQVTKMDLTDTSRKVRTRRMEKQGRWDEQDERSFRMHMERLGRSDWC